MVQPLADRVAWMRSVDDDRSYRITRRRNPTTRINLRDVVIARDDRKTERDLPVAPTPTVGPLAVPSLVPAPVATPAPAPVPAAVQARARTKEGFGPPLAPRRRPEGTGVVIERRTFAGIDIVIEHRGDEVTLVIPGAARLVGTRAEAMDLIAGLLGRT
jgi:hypothetical protein